MYRILVLVVLLAVPVFAQDKRVDAPEEKPDTTKHEFTKLPKVAAEDQLDLKRAEVDLLMAMNNLQNSSVWQTLQAAQARQKAVMGLIFDKYKLDQNKFVLCDGPGQGVCKDAPLGDLVFREVEKKK